MIKTLNVEKININNQNAKDLFSIAFKEKAESEWYRGQVILPLRLYKYIVTERFFVVQKTLIPVRQLYMEKGV